MGDAFRWEEEHVGHAVDLQLVAEVVRQGTVDAVEVHGRLHLRVRRAPRTHGEGFGGLLHLDGEIVAGTLEGGHHLHEVRHLRVGLHVLEGELVLHVDVGLLRDLARGLRDEVDLTSEEENARLRGTPCPGAGGSACRPW